MQEGSLSTESYEADSIAKQTLLATGSGVWKWNAKDFKEVGDHAVAGMICALRGADLASPCGGLLDVLRADDRERLLAKLELASTKGKSFHFSATVIDTLGSAKVLTLRGAPLPDDPNTIVALCFLDEPCDSDHFSICPKIPAQCASVIDSAVDAIVTKSLTGEITSWNRAAEALFGYSQQEVIGKSITMLIPASRQHEEVEILSRLGLGERILNYESIRLHKSGDPIHVSLTISPIFDPQGAIVGASKIVRNITDRVMATEKLRLSEQRLRFAISSFGRGIWDFNVQTGYVLVSPLTPSGTSGESCDFSDTFDWWLSNLHPDDSALARKAMDDYLQGRSTTYSIEYRQCTEHGGWNWLHVFGKAVEYGADGRPLRMVGTYADITEIKLAEGDLLLKEAAINASQAAILIANRQGNLTYVNPAFLRMWEFDRADEVVGRNVDEFRQLEGLRDFVSFEEVVERGVFHGEVVAKRRDGKTFDIYVVANAVSDPGGGEVCITASVIDLTEIKRNEAQLRVSEAKYRSLIEGAPEVILILDVDSDCIVDANPEACRFFGYTLEQLCQVDPSSLAPVVQPWFGDTTGQRQQILQDAASGLLPIFDWQCFRFDGATIPCEVRIARVPDVKRTLIRVMIVDVSEREEYQRKLKESESLLRGIIEGTSDAVYLKDTSGRYQMINTASASMLGKSVEEILGKDDVEVFGEAIAAEIGQIDQRVIQQKEHLTHEAERIVDGVEKCFITTKSPFLSSTGESLGVIGVTRDVSELRRADKALRETRALLSSFFEMSPVAMAVYDCEGRYTRVNSTLSKLLDQPPEWFVGKVLCSDVGVIQNVLQTGASITNLERTLQLPSRAIPFNGIFSYFPIVEADGVIKAVGMVVVDISQQKQAKLLLRESEERFRVLFESSPNAIVLTNTEFEVVALNRAATEFTGYTFQELKQQGVDCFPALQLLKRSAGGDALSHDEECVVVPKDGVARNVLVSTRLVTLAGQQHYLMVVVDITQRKRAEASIRDSEQMLRAFIDNAPVGVAMVDRELRYLAHSRRWLSEMHVDPDSVIVGRSHHELFPSSITRWNDVFRFSLLGNAARCEIDEVVRPDGTCEIMRWEVQPWRLPDGSVGGLVFFSELITERVRTERALRESQERLAEAQQIAKIGDWSWRPDSNQLLWSDEVFRIFGAQPRDFVPDLERHFLAAVVPGDRDFVRTSLQAALGNRAPLSMEFRMLSGDGREKVLQLLCRSGTFQFPSVRELTGTIQDITGLRDAEREMMVLRSQVAHAGRVATMGEMAAGIAHELNQPLAAISLYAEGNCSILEQGVVNPTETIHGFREIAELAERCGAIIRRLRRYATKQESAHSTFNLVEVLRATREFLGNEIQKSQVKLSLHCSSETIWVRGDSLAMQQVFINIVKNAIDSQEENELSRRQVDIQVDSTDEKFAVVTIQDRGCGMTTQQLQNIFSPFFTTKAAGLGMGLKIAQTIIRAHLGDISCSSSVGQGSTFTVTIPVARDSYDE